MRIDDLARDVKIDKFQLIHALHNFIELQPLAQEEVTAEELAHKKDRLKAVETHLASSATDKVSNCWDSITTVRSGVCAGHALSRRIAQLQQGVIHWDSWHWFVEAIQTLTPILGTSGLVHALRSPLEKSPFDRNHIRLQLQLNSATQITATFVKESKKLKEHRATLLARLQILVSDAILATPSPRLTATADGTHVP